MWNYTERFFRNQGPENSGYATDSFLERLARQTPGLDVDQLASDFGSPRGGGADAAGRTDGPQLGVDGTPSFYLVQDGGEPEPIEIDALGEALGGG